MIEHLQIKNFKGWKDTGPISLAPITLFFGANSSGKSSIGQFLMLLKQTVESQDRKAVLFPGGRKAAVQLGSFQEMVFERDKKNSIDFNYRWTLPTRLTIHDQINDVSFSADSIQFDSSIGNIDSEENFASVNFFKYELFDSAERLPETNSRRSNIMSIKMTRKTDSKSTKKPEFMIEAGKYDLRRYQGRAWLPGPPVRFYGFPDEVVAYHQNADFVQILNLEHEKLFGSLSYLGPMRTKTERLYSWDGNKPGSVGYEGENTISAILAAKNRQISMGKKKKLVPFQQVIAQKLKDMGLIEDFEVNQISKNRQNFEVKLKTKGSAGLVDLPDVGFGLSQVLPVLVECFYAPANSIILMEQPEIHLHPRAQAALADVMIDAINAREDGKDRNIQLIIETHSEHFLRRLQRRIAEDVVCESRVAAYFAVVAKTPAALEVLKIDIFGNIANWPENFFGDEMEDITQQSKAAILKRKVQTENANQKKK